MTLRKQEVKKEETVFVWTFQGDRPVFLVPVEGNLQWVDSQGYHVGDSGVNEGSIKLSADSKNDLAKILSDLMESSAEESMQTIEGLANEIQSYPAGTTVYYTYEDGMPILEDELEDDEFETPSVPHVETVQEVLEVKPEVKAKAKNDYSSVGRQTLLHHLRKYKIKVGRGIEDSTLIDIITFADSNEWDKVKSHPAVNFLNGEKTKKTSMPTSSEMTKLSRDIAKSIIQEPTEPVVRETKAVAVEDPEEERTFLTFGELVNKAKGYNWNFSLEEIAKTFEGQDLKVITAIYGSRDNEEIAFNLERAFDLSPLQIGRLLDGFVFGADEYPSLVELLLDSQIVS